MGSRESDPPGFGKPAYGFDQESWDKALNAAISPDCWSKTIQKSENLQPGFMLAREKQQEILDNTALMTAVWTNIARHYNVYPDDALPESDCLDVCIDDTIEERLIINVTQRDGSTLSLRLVAATPLRDPEGNPLYGPRYAGMETLPISGEEVARYSFSEPESGAKLLLFEPIDGAGNRLQNAAPILMMPGAEFPLKYAKESGDYKMIEGVILWSDKDNKSHRQGKATEQLALQMLGDYYQQRSPDTTPEEAMRHTAPVILAHSLGTQGAVRTHLRLAQQGITPETLIVDGFAPAGALDAMKPALMQWANTQPQYQAVSGEERWNRVQQDLLQNLTDLRIFPQTLVSDWGALNAPTWTRQIGAQPSFLMNPNAQEVARYLESSGKKEGLFEKMGTGKLQDFGIKTSERLDYFKNHFPTTINDILSGAAGFQMVIAAPYNPATVSAEYLQSAAQPSQTQHWDHYRSPAVEARLEALLNQDITSTLQQWQQWQKYAVPDRTPVPFRPGHAPGGRSGGQ